MSDLNEIEQKRNVTTTSDIVVRCFCCAGLCVWIVSLFLPSFRISMGDQKGLPGWFCLAFGWPWYLSNVALVVSPFVISKRRPKVSMVISSIIFLTLIANIVWGQSMQPAPFIGYWVWTAGFGVTILGVAITS